MPKLRGQKKQILFFVGVSKFRFRKPKFLLSVLSVRKRGNSEHIRCITHDDDNGLDGGWFFASLDF